MQNRYSLHFAANTTQISHHIIFLPHICPHIDDNLTELLPMNDLLYIHQEILLLLFQAYIISHRDIY